jgi:hypothetical protein
MLDQDLKISGDPKQAAYALSPTSLSDDFRKRMGQNLPLTEKQKNRLKAWLKARLSEWKNDTEELHRILEEDNDLVEGVVPETDFPWEGASNVHIPVTEMYMEVYKSIEKRSILGADLIWYGETDIDELKDQLADIEEALNYKARNEWNIEQCLARVFWTTNRDGLGVMQITWAEEYEEVNDVILITTPEEFAAEFPSPDEMGIDAAEYKEWAAAAALATELEPLEVPITFEKEVYRGCKGEVVELIDFVTIPATAHDIKDRKCRGYGKRTSYRKGELRDKAKDEVFYEDAVNRLLSKTNRGSSVSQFRQAQDRLEGLNRSDKDNFTVFELVVKGRLDGPDDEERKYLVTYSEDGDELLQCMEYFYRVDFYALFRINERPNRLIGRSIPRKTRDLNDEIDTQHNQRINTRTISSIPSFKAQANLKNTLDPSLQQNKWKPGVIFWLTDFEAFEQFKVQPTDQGESLSEEENDFKILDLFLGSAVSLLSGATAPGDPSAPGNKTAIMIQQSNLRMDDPLAELRDGVNQVGDICISHQYQFGPTLIEYQKETESADGVQRETRSVHRKWLRRGINMRMKGVTVVNNPDAEMQKFFTLYQTLSIDPIFQQNAQGRIELLRDALRAGRVPGRNRYLPGADEIQQQQIEMQKQAMLQMDQEKQQAAQAKAAEEQKARLAQAGQEDKVNSMADKIADRSLALVNGPAAKIETTANGVQANASAS